MVIALFSTGLKVERKLRWREWSTVTRLLAIGMPAFIALAALFGCGGDGALGRRGDRARGRARPDGPRARGRHRRRAARRGRRGARAALRRQRRGRLQRRTRVPVRAARDRDRRGRRSGVVVRRPTSSTGSSAATLVGRGARLRHRGLDRAPARPRPADRRARRLGRRRGDAADLRRRRGDRRPTASWPCSRAGSRSAATSATTSSTRASTTAPRSSRSSASSR